jgi:DNA invertase Pin-like site-specific DNA recombinase
VRALIYARVSSDPKAIGRSVDEQLAECVQRCETQGWDVAATIRDDNRSASRHAKQKRKGWEEVKRRIEAGGVDVLVTWEASRAQRDLAAYTELRELCERTKTLWDYSGTTYNLADRSDRFRTGLDALTAEDEADRTRERVLRAVRSNAAKGRPHGKRVFGYRRVYDENTGVLLSQEPDPVQAPLVREAAERFLAGESTRAIANDWNRREIPSPRAGERGWQLSQIRRLLTNPAYAARRVHQGKIIGKADWPAIFDGDTFDALVERFNDPTRRTSRRSPEVRLLSGVARCGKCGGPMSYAKQGGFGDRKERLTYTCRYKLCTARDLRQLEAFVTAVVIERLSAPDARAALSDDDALAEVAVARAEATELRARLAEAVEQFTAGALSAATLAQIEGSLLPKIAEADKAARLSTLPTAARTLAAADDPAGRWLQLSHDQQREVIRTLLEVVVLPVATRGRKAFDPASVRIEWRSPR